MKKNTILSLIALMSLSSAVAASGASASELGPKCLKFTDSVMTAHGLGTWNEPAPGAIKDFGIVFSKAKMLKVSASDALGECMVQIENSKTSQAQSTYKIITAKLHQGKLASLDYEWDEIGTVTATRSFELDSDCQTFHLNDYFGTPANFGNVSLATIDAQMKKRLIDVCNFAQDILSNPQ